MKEWQPGDIIKVVIIDDDREDFLVTKELLNDVEQGLYETLWVSDYSAGVIEIKKQEADVYLIDFNLGAKSGLDILEEVRSFNFIRPMILLTGMNDREIDLASMEAGAADFLKKNQLSAEILERSIRYSMKSADDFMRIKGAEKAKAEKEVAEAANLAKSRFLAHMSHEIRTPLTAMLGFTELAKDPQHSSDEKAEFLEVIKRSGDHLLRVINDILDLSRVEDGNFEIEATEFNFIDVISDVIKLFEPAAHTKGITISLKVDNNLPPVMSSDSRLFRQILTNMLGNAVKFTHRGRITIGVESNSNNSGFIIAMRDTGLGIAPDEQKKLFQPFSQANASLNRKFGGSGLGLDLSRKLARLLAGDLILAQSTLGEGSTFNLNLPFHSLQNSIRQIHMTVKTPAPRRHSSESMSVLVAEDSADNQLLIKYFLKGTGIVPSFVSNGIEAVAKANVNQFDVILMDIQMPEMDGYEATSILRKSGHLEPIIALTAHTFKDEKENALLFGFTDFVSKPISRESLLKALREIRTPFAGVAAH